MATGPTFTSELALATGFSAPTLDRFMRDLRPELVRPSGKGGGRAAVHLNEYEAAWIILSLAALQPGGARKAATSLGRLAPEDEPGTNLWTTLALRIQRRATWIVSGRSFADPAVESEWKLTLCLEPLIAWTSWKRGRIEHRQYYREPEPELFQTEHASDRRFGVCRLTIIDIDVLNTASALYADTLKRTQSTLFSSSELPATEEEKPAPDDLKAAEVATPDGPQSDRPAKRQTAPVCKTEHSLTRSNRAMADLQASQADLSKHRVLLPEGDRRDAAQNHYCFAAD